LPFFKLHLDPERKRKLNGYSIVNNTTRMLYVCSTNINNEHLSLPNYLGPFQCLYNLQFLYVIHMLISVGRQGPQGPQGSTGDTGLSGESGMLGATGTTGDKGAQGATGQSGLVGNVGQPGNAGAVGFTGATGPKGSFGATGVTGSTGSLGGQGATGLPGSKGAAGDTGATGTPGLSQHCSNAFREFLIFTDEFISDFVCSLLTNFDFMIITESVDLTIC
jgi:Collagen triple helix repeat (20 copies)